MSDIDPTTPDDTAAAIAARERIRHLYLRSYCPKCMYPTCRCNEEKPNASD